MQLIIGLLFVLLFVALIVGLIKPSLIIRWGDKEQRTRKQVAGAFFFAFIGLTLVCMLTSDSTSKNDVSSNSSLITNAEQQQETTSNMDTGINMNSDETSSQKGHNGDGVTKHPDGTLIVVSGSDTAEFSARYQALNIDKNRSKMKSDDLRKILGQKEYNKLEDVINSEESRNSIANIAINNGFQPAKYDGDWMIVGHIYKIDKSNPKNIEWCADITREKTDIRKANPDFVVAEMNEKLRGIVKDMPDFSEITISNIGTESKGIATNSFENGDLHSVILTYYKDFNVVTKLVTTCQEVDGKKGFHRSSDIVQ